MFVNITVIKYVQSTGFEKFFPNASKTPERSPKQGI